MVSYSASRLTRSVKFVLFFFVGAISVSLNAQISATPSLAQIEQFKKLPKEQQKSLAKQFGFDSTEFNSSVGDLESKDRVLPELEYLNAIEDRTHEQKSIEALKTKDTLQPFGLNLFQNSPTAFMPEGQVIVPADYVIGIGDELAINFYGKESKEFRLTVSSSGELHIPELAPISVTGLTFQELKRHVAETIKIKMIGIDVSVSVIGLGGIQVYVIGDVVKPGAYYLSSLSTVTNALYMSGGPTEVGSFRNIELKRGNKTVADIDLYGLLLKGETSTDIRLQQGDVIFVNPIDKQITVTGEVKRPAIYELKGNETVSDVLAMSGGLSLSGYPRNAVLVTLNDAFQRDVIRIDLQDPHLSMRDVKNGDILSILPISENLDKVVTIVGHVARPSTYSWKSSMKLSDLVTSDDDLLPSTDLDYALVISKKNDGQYSIAQFKPRDILNNKKIDIAAGSIVLFFNRYGKDVFVAESEDIKHEENKSHHFEANETNQLLNLDEQSGIDLEPNYLFQIHNGTFLEKQEVLSSTKGLTRNELIQPILKLLEASNDSAQLLPIAEITGQVKFPGRYPLSPDATILSLIDASGGLTESANLSNGEVSRTSYLSDGAPLLEHINFKLGDALNQNSIANFNIVAKDVINIFQRSSWQEELKVTLKGEVKYPGTYTISQGENLSSLVSRAGGLTPLAAAESAFFSREAIKTLEQEQAKTMARSLSKELAIKSISSTLSNINISDVQLLVSQLTKIEGVGRLVIDLPNILTNGKNDITLENGDFLMIPSSRNEVNVMGEVQVVTSHLYDRSWSVDDYISSSGGLRVQADDDRIYIIRANGLVDIHDTFLGFWGAEVKPGDTIVAPLDADYTDKLTLWEKSTSIFYQLTVGLAALSSFR